MDEKELLAKIFWRLQTNWHLRRRSTAHELSVPETVKGLQRLLLAKNAAILVDTLQQVFAHPVYVENLQRLEIALYQEGADQRVWRAQATLADGHSRLFGIIVARTPGAENATTQRDFTNLKTLYTKRHTYCVQPYVSGTIPIAGGVTTYTVEWLEDLKELVFEIAREGGVFLVNAYGAHRVFTPEISRQIWRRLIEILWCYAGLCKINIQAGDFVGRQLDDGQFELKLTTARDLQPDPGPTAHLHVILRSVITASGYLSDGRHPFNRQMTKAMFQHRMQAVLQRRFGNRAERLAHQQWRLFQDGIFARQEDWLKDDCILATYNFLRATTHPIDAWQTTRQYWLAYADAVQANIYPPSWWFPAVEIPAILERLTPPEPHIKEASHEL
jgi:hypothetical protein